MGKVQSGESQEQRVVVSWCHAMGVGVMSIPNGLFLGSANTRYSRIAKAKAEGLLVGAPDLVLLDLASDNRPVAIEMKSLKGRVTSEQALVHARMRLAGWHVIIARGADQAIHALEDLGIGRSSRRPLGGP